jgi:hypothetical protein
VEFLHTTLVVAVAVVGAMSRLGVLVVQVEAAQAQLQVQARLELLILEEVLEAVDTFLQEEPPLEVQALLLLLIHQPMLT